MDNIDMRDYWISDKGALYLTPRGIKKALNKFRKQFKETKSE